MVAGTMLDQIYIFCIVLAHEKVNDIIVFIVADNRFQFYSKDLRERKKKKKPILDFSPTPQAISGQV